MTYSIDVSTFHDVDTAPDPQGLIRFLDGARNEPTLAELQRRLIAELHLRPGMRVLDAGCGPGTQSVELAQTVDGMAVIGVDSSKLMIDEAVRRTADMGLNVSFEVADVAQLPFPDEAFDAVLAQTVFEHVEDAGAAVAELTRVTREGGRVAGLSIDTASAVIDHPDASTTRRITETWADGFAGGRVGRALHRLFRDAGLVDAMVEVRAAAFSAAFLAALIRPTTERMVRDGALDREAADRWWTVFDERAASGAFVTASLWFLVAGTVPG
jgi:ubiquinone/menaquinone biosynthesis C-methylase UbiE